MTPESTPDAARSPQFGASACSLFYFMEKLKPAFVDLGQVMQEIEKDEKLISVKDGCVVMEWNHAGYIVELRRIKGWAELTDWMIHLCGKGWMTPDRLAIFAETAIKAKGWKRKNA